MKKKQTKIKKERTNIFFNFKKNKFSKKTVDYYTEIRRLTGDLINIASRVSRSLLLCKGDIELLNRGSFFPREFPNDFNDLRYHLENFCFRAGAYKDKMANFINQALQLGFGEREMGLVEKIQHNGIAKKYHLDTEIKKFYKNKSFT